ncbi:hypothetical protein ACH5RR_028958 [Cinchona calisaya]|uniref:Uncharacterized protein n=1 Tax=Cinchona calisaya TaxID=153742 RepID=A0ABD2YTK1_9GENT
MKNKFALCFRPGVIETQEPHDPDDHVAVSKDILVAKVQKKNGMISQTMNPSLLDSNNGGLHQVPYHPPRPKNHSRKTLSRVLKTILYETSPRMRVQNGKISQVTFHVKTNDDDHLEERNISPLEKMDNIIDQENNNNIIRSISPSPSSSSSSSIGSSRDQSSKYRMKSLSIKRSTARSRSNSFNQKQKAKTTKINDKTLDSASSSSTSEEESRDYVFYWTVLALLATILWGIGYAIILASLCLYFIPRRSSGIAGSLPENSAVKLQEIETSNSREYKKKVIMEGLLERKYEYSKEH